MIFINIGDIPICLNEGKELINENFMWLNDYIINNVSTYITFNLLQSNNLIVNGNIIYIEDKLTWLRNGSHFESSIISDNIKQLDAILRVDSNWQNIFIIKADYCSANIYKTYSEIAFRTIILYYNGLILHASAISFKDKGFVFSAPSGTGKSTQADLWVKHKGAKIINGDRPAIRVFDNEVRVYGTPWSGTSHQHLNMSVPLEAIFMLEQSSINEVSELSSADALHRITARCYLPYFDENLMELALNNIGQVIQRIPVYLLKCRPDSEAVDVVASCLGL